MLLVRIIEAYGDTLAGRQSTLTDAINQLERTERAVVISATCSTAGAGWTQLVVVLRAERSDA